MVQLHICIKVGISRGLLPEAGNDWCSTCRGNVPASSDMHAATKQQTVLLERAHAFHVDPCSQWLHMATSALIQEPVMIAE